MPPPAPARSSHLSGVLLNIMAGVKLVHVPYPGSPQGVTDLLAGRVSVMFSPASTVWPHVEAGQAQGAGDHGSQAAQRSRPISRPWRRPDCRDTTPASGSGCWRPPAHRATVVDKLASALNEALKADEVLTLLRAQSVEPLGGSPEEFARYIETDSSNWTVVAKAAGLKK